MEHLRAFFNRYEAAFNAVDPEALAQMYTDQLLMASLDYCTCSQNNDEFRNILASTAHIYCDGGMRAIRIHNYTESPLDDHFYLVQIEWKLFRMDGGELMTFDNTYLVRVVDGIPKIAFLIAHNEQQRMRESGLLPA